MNLNWLRVFVAVADMGSFTGAADSLHVSQPAVSRTVRLLEKQVGATLIDRRDARLTEAGERLVVRGREILRVEQVAEEELAALLGLERGVLRIGASTTVATYMLAPYLDRFARAHPGVDLVLTSANTEDIVDLLVSGDLGVALVEGPVDVDGVEEVVWREDELVVIAAVAHRLVNSGVADPASLAAERFLVREPGSGTRVVAEAALARAGVSLSNTIEMGSTEAIKQAVVAGLGLGIVSRSAVADQLILGTLSIIEVEGLEMRRQLSRLAVSGRTQSPAAVVFEGLLDQGS